MPEATFATFNIRHGRGRDGRVDLERIAEVILRSGADLIALQELDRGNPRSEGVDQPTELERLTGYRIEFLPTVASGERSYGIALGHRSDGPAEISSLDLPRLGHEEPRKLLTCRWNGLSILATHLSVEKDVNHRQQVAVAEAVRPELAQAVVMGDLNAPRWRLAPLSALGLQAPQVWRPTVAPWWRLRRIDHVLAAPPMTVLRAWTIATGASDHRLVAVSLRWRVEDVAGVTYDA